MKKSISKSIGIGLMLILSILIVTLGYYSTILPDNCRLEEPHYHDGELYYKDTIN